VGFSETSIYEYSTGFLIESATIQSDTESYRLKQLNQLFLYELGILKEKNPILERKQEILQEGFGSFHYYYKTINSTASYRVLSLSFIPHNKTNYKLEQINGYTY